jgi:hypothetical protein
LIAKHQTVCLLLSGALAGRPDLDASHNIGRLVVCVCRNGFKHNRAYGRQSGSTEPYVRVEEISGLRYPNAWFIQPASEDPFIVSGRSVEAQNIRILVASKTLWAVGDTDPAQQAQRPAKKEIT